MFNIYNLPIEKLKDIEENDYSSLNKSKLFKSDGMDLIKNDIVKVCKQLNKLLKE